MTDNEIMKALDSVGTATGVALGPHSEQADIIADRFRELIDENNCQKAEIERLKKNIDGLNIFTTNHIKVIRLQAMKEFAERFEYFVLNENIEVVEPKCKDYESYINGANQFRHQIKNGINNLVKEMMEVEINQKKEDERKC